jgi:hypothetical protein
VSKDPKEWAVFADRPRAHQLLALNHDLFPPSGTGKREAKFIQPHILANNLLDIFDDNHPLSRVIEQVRLVHKMLLEWYPLAEAELDPNGNGFENLYEVSRTADDRLLKLVEPIAGYVDQTPISFFTDVWENLAQHCGRA